MLYGTPTMVSFKQFLIGLFEKPNHWVTSGQCAQRAITKAKEMLLNFRHRRGQSSNG
jgi:hypothetical protein